MNDELNKRLKWDPSQLATNSYSRASIQNEEKKLQRSPEYQKREIMVTI